METGGQMGPDETVKFVCGQAGVEHDEPLAVQRRQPQVTGANRLVKRGRLLFHAVGRQQQRTSPLIRAQQANVWRQVEQEGHVRSAVAGGELVDHIDHRRVEPTGHALVNGCRIQETVANHHPPTRQCGQDRLADQLRAAGGEQEQFRFGRHAPVRRGTPQQTADFLAQRSAARFAQERDRSVRPPVSQVRAQTLDLRGLPQRPSSLQK